MHVCIIGAGLAGCLLAWRLRAADEDVRVDLVGAGRPADATSASGGLVRGFELDRATCAAAAASLAELRDSAVLRAWAGYREVGSTYVCEADAATVQARVEAVDALLPGSAAIVPADRLQRDGSWAGLPERAVAVVESRAGCLSPAALRDAVLADAVGPRVLLHEAAVDRLAVDADGATVTSAGAGRRYDVAVVAAGRWTGALLERSGLDAAPYRVKAIQYALHDAAGDLPPPFVDDTSGLYGRRAGATTMLLGVPTDRYGIDPDAPAGVPHLVSRAAALAVARLPRLMLGGVRRVVVAADCYTDPPGLRLRAVAPGARLLTFTGGSGGAAKTALAAAGAAARALLDDEPCPHVQSASLATTTAST